MEKCGDARPESSLNLNLQRVTIENPEEADFIVAVQDIDANGDALPQS